MVVSTRSFFLTSPVITHTSGSTKIEQSQQRLLLQDELMRSAGSNFRVPVALISQSRLALCE